MHIYIYIHTYIYTRTYWYILKGAMEIPASVWVCLCLGNPPKMVMFLWVSLKSQPETGTLQKRQTLLLERGRAMSCS